MGSPLAWLAVVAFSTLVAVALIVLGLRNAIRAVALGYTAVLVVFFLPIALMRSEAGLPAMALAPIVISAVFAIPAIFLSVLGAALLLTLTAARPPTARFTSIAIGVVLGTLGGFVLGTFKISSGGASPWWSSPTLGAVVGSCWGILAPSVIRPNKPLQPTSGGNARRECGSMGCRRSRLSGKSLDAPKCPRSDNERAARDAIAHRASELTGPPAEHA